LKIRVDALIDDLFREGSVASASMASILLAARDSAENGYLLELSRRVWTATNELKSYFPPAVEPSPNAKGSRRREKRQSV
jgi:hypothetical protein